MQRVYAYPIRFGFHVFNRFDHQELRVEALDLAGFGIRTQGDSCDQSFVAAVIEYVDENHLTEASMLDGSFSLLDVNVLRKRVVGVSWLRRTTVHRVLPLDGTMT